jgi:hypothetical protein
MSTRVNQHTGEGKINQAISAAGKGPKWGPGTEKSKIAEVAVKQVAAGKTLISP